MKFQHTKTTEPLDFDIFAAKLAVYYPECPIRTVLDLYEEINFNENWRVDYFNGNYVSFNNED